MNTPRQRHCVGRQAKHLPSWRELGGKLEELNKNEQEKLRLLDLWSFQQKEIESVQPRIGEDAELEAERKILQNVTKLQENAAAAFALMYESPQSATTAAAASTEAAGRVGENR